MAKKRIVVIGGVAAGPKAAARARRRDPEAEITVIEQGHFLSYAGCGMPFYIGDMMKEPDSLMSNSSGVIRDASFFSDQKSIKVLTGTRAEAINREDREIEIIDLGSGQKSRIKYDKLVLATGSIANRPPIPGFELGNVFTLGNINDAINVKSILLTGAAKKVVLVGAGLISLELADSIKGYDQDLDITIVELMDYLMPAQLDPEISALVLNYLRKKGIKLLTSQKVIRFEGEGRVEKVITESGVVEANLVVVAAGARPATKLAEKAGLKRGLTGAIAVNEHMQTSDPDIYAAGDCVESKHLITKEPFFAPMGSTANRQGRVVGDNVTGGQSIFPGVLGTAILKVFNLNLGRTGLTEHEAKRLGYEITSFICSGYDRAHFYPGHNTIITKLLADNKTRKLIGAQIVGSGDVSKRLDVVVTAISMGATVDQLANFDLAYAPPFATALDAITHAANSVRNKLDGMAKSISPLEVKAKINRGEDFILLDVRYSMEFDSIRLPYDNVILIPLDELAKRVGELPIDQEIITYCTISVRGYEAQLILEGKGFKNVKFLEGGLTAWPYEIEK